MVWKPSLPNHYSVWPSCHKSSKLPSQKLWVSLLLFPIISRQFRTHSQIKILLLFSIPNSDALRSRTTISDSLVLAVTTRRIGQKTRVFYCRLQWVGREGSGGKKKKKDDRRNSWLELSYFSDISRFFCQLPLWLHLPETMPRGMTAIYHPSKLHSKAFIQKVFHQHTEAKLHFL